MIRNRFSFSYVLCFIHTTGSYFLSRILLIEAVHGLSTRGKIRILKAWFLFLCGSVKWSYIAPVSLLFLNHNFIGMDN